MQLEMHSQLRDILLPTLMMAMKLTRVARPAPFTCSINFSQHVVGVGLRALALQSITSLPCSCIQRLLYFAKVTISEVPSNNEPLYLSALRKQSTDNAYHL